MRVNNLPAVRERIQPIRRTAGRTSFLRSSLLPEIPTALNRAVLSFRSLLVLPVMTRARQAPGLRKERLFRIRLMQLGIPVAVLHLRSRAEAVEYAAIPLPFEPVEHLCRVQVVPLTVNVDLRSMAVGVMSDSSCQRLSQQPVCVEFPDTAFTKLRSAGRHVAPLFLQWKVRLGIHAWKSKRDAAQTDAPADLEVIERKERVELSHWTKPAQPAVYES